MKNEISHVCIPATMYALLQYMLLFDDDIVFNKTFYFFIDAIPVNIQKCFNNYYPFCLSFDDKTNNFIRRKFIKIHYVMQRSKFPFLETAKIYAVGDSSYIWIGKKNYSLLADAPGFLTRNMNEDCLVYQRQIAKGKTFKGKVESIIFGKPVIYFWGNNNQCTSLYLTEENFSPVLAGKTIHIESLQNLWNLASQEKKDFILNMFGIDGLSIELLSAKHIWFFTQPFTTDAKLTDEEYYKLLQELFKKYDTTQLVIKLHPRDKFDYHKYFPQISTYSKPVNMQLLILNNILPEKAIAICTGAIDCLPDSVSLDWYGASVHPKILEFFGDKLIPQRLYNKITL